ncbi:enoyl-CoA hydratase [Planctomycetaceae bacterium SCGC AG-212-F19]|nr:enoyl-CoA hydratase [Planctomycetaceae bacterium SCGC AG-212-F19]
MSEPAVLYSVQPPAAIVTLNRPDRRNAISRDLIAAATVAFQKARDDAGVRVVILTGAGKAFCAGMDLAELTESLQNVNEAGKVWDDAQHLSGLYQLIYTLPKPTIAAVNGAAVAGGAGFVTVCDLALAVPEAKFGYPEVRRGLVAAMVMPHLLRHVGERCARYLLLTGDLIDAEEARRTGLINDVVPSADHLLERSMALAKSLAEGGPNALTLTKALLAQFSRQAISVEETAKASAAPRLSSEAREGLEAFFAKKPAPWAPNG